MHSTGTIINNTILHFLKLKGVDLQGSYYKKILVTEWWQIITRLTVMTILTHWKRL